MHCSVNLADSVGPRLCHQTGQNKNYCTHIDLHEVWALNSREEINITPVIHQSCHCCRARPAFRAASQTTTFVFFVNIRHLLASCCVERRNLAACQLPLPDDREVLRALFCWLIEAADLRRFVCHWAGTDGGSQCQVKTVIMWHGEAVLQGLFFWHLLRWNTYSISSIAYIHPVYWSYEEQKKGHWSR